ncbi:MAG: hypothetical protein KAI81_09430 [Candidatus Marinimicrobia bacterium]|nr:hypothetical protein [Candidatus Neomarinimicrobiota bacterium]
MNDEINDTEAPLISINTPGDSTTLYGIFEIKSVAEDNRAIAEVNYYLNDSLLNVQTLNRAPYSWLVNSTALNENIPYELKAQAIDNSENESNFSKITLFIYNKNQAPLQPKYFQFGSIGKHFIELEWEASVDRRFLNYEIFRSYRDSTTFPDSAIAIITNKEEGNYLDYGTLESERGLIAKSSYYYKIKINNTDSLSTTTKTLRSETLGPEKIRWIDGGILEEAKSFINLSIYPLSDEDLADLDYVTLRRIGSSKDTLSRDIYLQDFTTTLSDTALIAESLYSYQINQTDSCGNSSDWSKIISGETINFSYQLNIQAETKKTSTQITWDSYLYNDFASYTIYFSEFEDIPEDLSKIFKTIFSSDSNQINITGLDQNTRYYMVIRVSDTYGNESDTPFSFSTHTIPPPVLTITTKDKYSINLIYSVYDNIYNDFSEYILYKCPSSTSDISEGQIIYQSTNINSLEYTDSDLQPQTQHHYQLQHKDSEGNFSLSNFCTVLTSPLNFVEIDTFSTTDSVNFIAWDWVDEADDDFTEFNLLRYNRHTGSDNWSAPESILRSADSMQYHDESLDTLTEYAYQIMYSDPLGNDSYSRISGIDCGSPLSAQLSFSGLSQISVSFHWYITGGPADITNFHRIYLYKNMNSIFPEKPIEDENLELIFTLSRKNINDYTIHNVEKGKIYYYKLYFENNCGEISSSNIVSAIPVP